MNTEWTKITKDAKEAKAAKTLICQTRDIRLGIESAPIKYPTKYQEIIKTVDVKLKPSRQDHTPSKEHRNH